LKLTRSLSRQCASSAGASTSAFAQLHEGDDLLAPAFVLQTGHGHLVDGRVQRQHGLDVDRRDVLAAADDHVVDAAGDEQVAFGVDVAGVAGEVPAAVQALRIGIGALVVALEGFVAAQLGDDLALFHRARPGARVALVELDDTQPCVEPGTAGAAGLGHGALVDR
jgi:hypothetical protein